MYLLDLIKNDTAHNGEPLFRTDHDGSTLRKWSLLRDSAENHRLLQMIALTCAGQPYADQLLRQCQGDLLAHFAPGSCGHAFSYSNACHAPYDGTKTSSIKRGKIVFNQDAQGNEGGKGPDDPLPGEILRQIRRNDNAKRFSLALGAAPDHHQGTDDFDFNDLLFKLNRYRSLFVPDARITDPIALLTRIHYKAIIKGRFPAKQTLHQLCALFPRYLEVDTSDWQAKQIDFDAVWHALQAWQQRSMLPVLDMVRHLIDAFPRSGDPIQMHGVVILATPERHCDGNHFSDWMRLLDRLFPNIQFIATLNDDLLEQIPATLLEASLTLPAVESKEKRKPRASRPSFGPNTILLLHIDGRLPNLALMKLSSYYKSSGYDIRFSNKIDLLPAAEQVFASTIFYNNSSRRAVERLKKYYGESIHIGGSGVDLQKRLPPEIEACEADYQLYPQLGDRAIGFITRGCPYRCKFCLVPQKEGNVRQVSDLDDLLMGRDKLILLDDNLLALPTAGAIIDEMARRKLAVNFTQTLDIRLLDDDLVRSLKRVAWSNTPFTRRVIHFSINGLSGLKRIQRNYRLFDFRTDDNVEFICMYDFDTTLEEDVERFRFIRSLPGAYVFVQRYQPVIGAPAKPRVEFFGPDADRQIDQLLTIEYRQNMKSMEQYYRWLSQRYVEAFGRIHQRLVDTIFRYNHREAKGLYIAKLLAGSREIRID